MFELFLLNYVYCLMDFPATLLFHQINRAAQCIILHSFKISTFLPITFAIHLAATRDHRGCICALDCHVQAAHHCCMLLCKEIGLAGICPLMLSSPHQYVVSGIFSLFAATYITYLYCDFCIVPAEYLSGNVPSTI